MLFSNNYQLDDLSDDQLAAAEAEATKSQTAERLLARFGATAQKSWLVRNQPMRQTAHYGSYFFNIISALAGFYGARILFQMLPIPLPYFDYIMAVLFLFCLEKYKRSFSDRFWDNFFARKKILWGYAALNFGLLAISLSLSVFGVYFAARDFAPEANYIGGGDNPEVVALQDQLLAAEGKLQDLKDDPSSYNSQGQFYYKLMDTRNALEAQIADLTATLKDKHGVINIQNKDILADYQLRNAFRGNFSVAITLLAELLFELCMAFASYYDWRYCRALLASQSKQPRGQRLNGHSPNGGVPGKQKALAV